MFFNCDNKYYLIKQQLEIIHNNSLDAYLINLDKFQINH